MNDNGTVKLELLLFSVGGVHFGVDAGQVSKIAAYDGEQADDLFWFDAELEYAAALPAYEAPMVVTIRTGAAKSYRIIVDLLEDIAGFSPDDIRLVPALLEPFAMRKGLWAILPRNGKLVLLVDFQLLLKQQRT